MEREWTQGELARRAKMAQPRISEIETPGERKLNLDTLQRLASAFDIGLDVDFVSFGELIKRNEGFDPDSFGVQSFEPELAAAREYRQLIPTNQVAKKRQRCPRRFDHQGSHGKRATRNYRNSSRIRFSQDRIHEDVASDDVLKGQAQRAGSIGSTSSQIGAE
jgi:transcriptional regulator with XRE-family HTH domain